MPETRWAIFDISWCDDRYYCITVSINDIYKIIELDIVSTNILF